MRRKLLPLVLGGVLSIAAVAPAAASNHQTVNQDAVQRALVGLIVQAAVRDVNVAILNDSLNNLLQNADIDIVALNNSLNNILQNVNIEDNTFTVVGDDLVLTVTILGGTVVVSQ